MPLLRNKFQPYFPDPDAPALLDCNGSYCWPMIVGDKFYQQWYQTPCADNLVNDPDFEDITVGAELLTNGTFTGSAASWTLGPDWSYAADQIDHTASGNFDDVTQTGLTITGGDFYQLEIVVDNLSSGYVNILLGSGAIQATFQENGTWTVIIPAGNSNSDIVIQSSIDFTGSIQSISLKPVTYGAWLPGAGWLLEDGEACFSGGVASDLYDDGPTYFVSGDYYKVVVNLSTVTAGSLQFFIDDGAGGAETNLQTAMSTQGEFTYYITASQNGTAGFKPSATFVGCIASVEVYALRNDYSGDIVASDGTRYDISPYFVYDDDKVILNSTLFDTLELTYGCYTVEIFDACLVSGTNLVTDGTFANGDYTNWQRNNGSSQYDITGGTLQLIFEPLEGANLIANGGFASGASWTAGAGWTIAAGVATHTPGSTATLSQTVTITNPVTPPSVLVHWWQLTISAWTTGTITVTLSDKTSVTFGVNDTITSFLIPTIGGSVTFAITPSSGFDGSIDNVALHESNQIWVAFPTITNTANTGFVAGNYQLTYDITARTGSTNIGAAMGILGMTQSNTYNTTIAAQTVNVNNYVPGAQRAYFTGQFRVGNIYYPGRITVDNAVAVRVEPFEASYISECINYQEEHNNTYMITAYSDQDSLGLAFEGVDYLLQFRIEARGLNPTYPRDGYNSQSGSGNYRLGYAALSKQYQLVFGMVSETAHDALAAAISSDHFLVGPSQSDSGEFVVEMEDYVPQWRAQGDYSLAPSQITMRLKEGGQKFTRHTG